MTSSLIMTSHGGRSAVAPSGVRAGCCPCPRRPVLLLLVLLAASSDHLSVLCFNPLVAASSSSSSASSAPSSPSGVFGRVSPYNLSVTSVEARAATVHWDPTPAIFSSSSSSTAALHNASSSTPSSIGDYSNVPPVTGFRVTLRPVFPGGEAGWEAAEEGPSSSGVSLMKPREVLLEGHRRSFSFQDLAPRTEYQVFIVAFSGEGRGNVTDSVTFTTLQESEGIIPRPAVRPTEVVLVVLILIAWFCAIALFLHQWGKIRVIQPREPRFKHSPKNLDTIKVVKKPTDSVIHKHYTRQVSRTMLMRETKRIERMNTMPNIKVNLEPLQDTSESSSAERLQKKFQTMPEIELENLSSGESQT